MKYYENSTVNIFGGSFKSLGFQMWDQAYSEDWVVMLDYDKIVFDEEELDDYLLDVCFRMF